MLTRGSLTRRNIESSAAPSVHTVPFGDDESELPTHCGHPPPHGETLTFQRCASGSMSQRYPPNPVSPARRQFEPLTEASRRTGLSPRTLRRRVAQGQLPAYRSGPRILRLDPAGR